MSRVEDPLVARSEFTGAHAAVFSALIRASHRLDVWLDGAAETDSSFPLTDGGDLPADSMLRAALTSRSCVTLPSHRGYMRQPGPDGE
jgi:hypothetical protein